MPFVRGPDGLLTHHTPSRRRNVTDNQGGRLRYPAPGATGDRESSPDKRTVSFGRRLERGPSPAYSRVRTAPRPAFVRNPIVPAEPVDIRVDAAPSDESDADSPSDQLWTEEKLATKHKPSEFHGKSRQSNKEELNVLFTTDQPELKDVTDEALRDDEVCRRVHELRADVVDFARGFVHDNSGKVRTEHCLKDLCSDFRHAQLIRYVGCLAQGGPDREASWRELLTNPECRVALVVGIIGTALKEHVFSELWFSGTDEQIEELEALQEKQKHGEGVLTKSGIPSNS
jgi:hypothetical protein